MRILLKSENSFLMGTVGRAWEEGGGLEEGTTISILLHGKDLSLVNGYLCLIF